MVIMHHYHKIGSSENLSLYKVGHMGANDSECIAKASLGELAHTGCSKNIFLAQNSNMVIMHLYHKIGFPENFSLYKKGIWELMVLNA